MIGGMRRLLSGVGRTLITAGVLLLLFVAYQLWGTGIRTAQQQSKLKKSFEAELAADGIVPIDINNVGAATLGTIPLASPGPDDTAVEDPTVDPVDTAPVDATADTGADDPSVDTAPTAAAPLTVPPVTSSTLPQVRSGRSKMKAPLPGKKLGLLVIPRINRREVVVEGTATNDLQSGPGRYSSTAYPGQPGNVGIAGHRTTYGAPFFNLHLLRIGDPIFIQTKQGNFRYDVIDACRPKCLGRSSFVVSPTDKTVLVNTPNDNILTLTTCHPQYTAKQRLIVRARLVGPAADADFFAPPPTTAPPTTAPPTTAPPTTAPPTTAPPETVAAPVPDVAPASDAASDTTASDTTASVETAPTSEPADTTADTTEDTTESASTVAEGASLSLQSERDPNGRGPVWKLSWLQGHRSTWLETGALSLLCAGIWAGFWALARRRRLGAQILLYGAGFVFVFLPALYFTFEHIARLLPENL